MRGDGALGAGGDIKANAVGEGSTVIYVEELIVQEAGVWREPSWPVQIGAIPTRAGYYQNRSLTREIVEVMDGQGSVERCRVLTGTGGVGKSQLAAEYARSVLRSVDVPSGMGCEGGLSDNGGVPATVDLLLWVNATSRQAIVDAYALATQAVVPGGATGLDANQAAQRFLAWLRTTARRWLIVLDDVSAPGLLTGLWPPEVPTGRALVTTRSRDAAWNTGTRTLSYVGMFTPDQSTAYLHRALLRPGCGERADSDSEVSALAADLGHLPLALAQAAAYLVDTGRDIPRYRALLADHVRHLARLVPEVGGLPDEQTRTVSAVWDVSLELAETYQPTGLARPVLELAAVLDSHAIPEQVLTASGARSYFTRRLHSADVGVIDGYSVSGGAEVDEVDAEDALRTLHRLNLLDHDPFRKVIRVHQLIQRAVREHAPIHDPAFGLISAGADALVEAWPHPERDTATALILRANADALIGRSAGILWQSGAHALLFRVGQSRGEVGEVRGAAKHFELLVDQCLAKVGIDHPDTLSARHEYAHWQGRTGDVVGALSAFEFLLADQLRIQGPDHPHTLAVRNEAAYYRAETGDIEGAMAEAEELLVDQLRVLGPDDPRTLASRSNVAGWRGQAGDLARAAAAYEALLSDRSRILGPDHPDTLRTRSEQAHWRGEAGDLAGAAAAYEALLSDRSRILGPDHPDTLTTRNNLAATRGYSGDAAGAAAAFRDVLTACERVLGSDHPRTLSARGNLAFWRARVGDVMGAHQAYADLLADRLRVLGPDHPDTLSSRSDFAAMSGETGNVAGAVRSYEQVLADRLRVLGPDHPDTLATRGNLAGWRGEAGDATGARDALAELLIDQLRVLGPDHPDCLATRRNLADLQGSSGDIAGAADAYTELLADTFGILGPLSPLTFETFARMEHWKGRAAGFLRKNDDV
ncbi:tetratricopeptide repeat protein [Streptomyces cyaneofuscatus]